MLICASKVNEEIILTREENIDKLASYNELLEELCLGNIELDNMTMVKDGIVIWDEEKSDIEFVRFRC